MIATYLSYADKTWLEQLFMLFNKTPLTVYKNLNN